MLNQPVQVMDKEAARKLNLNVLRRIDPETEEVLGTAGHVCLYDFFQDPGGTAHWERKGIEGSLFIIKRRSSPRFRMVVLNKKSQDNYFEDLSNGFWHELNKPYVLYKNKKLQVIALWFYDPEDYDKIVNLLQRVTALPREPPKEDPSSIQTAASNGSKAGSEDNFFDKRLDPSKQEVEAVLRQHEPADANAARMAPAVSAPASAPAPAGGALAAFFPALVGKGTLGGMPPLPVPSVTPLHHVSSASLGNGNSSPESALKATSRRRSPASEVAASSQSSAGLPPPPISSSPTKPQPGPVPVHAPPPAGRPMLLRPCDFAAQKVAEPTNAAPSSVTSMSEVNKGVPPELASMQLPGIFAKLMRPVADQPVPRRGEREESTPAAASDGTRDRVKAALASLLESDAFIDTITQHLKTAGLLK